MDPAKLRVYLTTGGCARQWLFGWGLNRAVK